MYKGFNRQYGIRLDNWDEHEHFLCDETVKGCHLYAVTIGAYSATYSCVSEKMKWIIQELKHEYIKSGNKMSTTLQLV